jgi:small-conductance mechanosensitive channel
MTVQSLIDALLEQIKPAESLAGVIINLVLALLVVVLGLGLARLAKRRLVRLVARPHVSGNLAVLLGNAAFIGIAVVACLVALRLLGIDSAAVVTVLGVSTVAIGLAMQDMLKNLFAGVFLLLEQPFRIGDTIVVDNREGEVESIEVRTTVLRMRDGTQALVPNAIVLATTVMNRTAYPTRRVSIKIAGLTEDVEAISNRAIEALANHPDLAETPTPQVYVESVVDGKTTVVVDAWRRADRDLSPKVLLSLRSAFPEASVSIQ